jgi:hypothetical protein
MRLGAAGAIGRRALTDYSADEFLKSLDEEAENEDAPYQGNRGRKPNGVDNEWRQLELIRFADIQSRLDGRPLVKGFLEREQISNFYGDTGCGKTFLVLDLSLHVAAGFAWFGRKVEQGAVVYIAAEAGRSMINRVAAWRTKQGLDGKDIPFAAITSSVDLCHPASGDLERLVAAIQAEGLGPISLVVIDTVSRVLAGGNENAPDDMGALVRSLDRLREELQCHIVVVHHTGKEAVRGPRGHSLLRAAVDTEIEVTRDAPAGTSTATITKQRDGPTEGEVIFRLQPVSLGFDQDGEEVTSCVIEPLGQSQATRPRRRPKLSAKQKIALDMLYKALAEVGGAAPPDNRIPSTATVVDVDLWRRYFYAAVESDGASAEARKKAFQRVREALQALQPPIIGIWNEQVWLVEPLP